MFLNNHEFVIASSQTNHKEDGIHKYDSRFKELSKLMDYPKDFISKNHITIIDQKVNSFTFGIVIIKNYLR